MFHGADTCIHRRSTGWELPGNVPYTAKTRLYRRFLDAWDEPADACLAGVWERLLDAMHLEVTEHFERFKRLELHVT